MNENKEVSVRWTDGYLEEFEVVEVRAGVDLLWMILVNGQNRHIPLRHVRWFSISPKIRCKSYSDVNPKSNDIPEDKLLFSQSNKIVEDKVW